MPLDYPFSLARRDIEALIPHRGDIFVCQSLTVNGPHSFAGVASWPRDNTLIQGHFPGLPVVPGVMLIESLAQLAGAGLLAGDPYVKTLTGDLIGVLASVRRCVFTHPVRPENNVEFDITCRQIGLLAVQVTGKVQSQRLDAAQLEILMVYTQRQQLASALGTI